jgi:hypothetical protein
MSNVYELSEIPEGVHKQQAGEGPVPDGMIGWSGGEFIPAIGDVVSIKFNSLGTGEVLSYFVEHNYLGLEVKLHNAPAWHKKQNKGTKFEGKSLVFGAEIV